jgi:phosphoglycolate phosphatase-like HAD superfamily hydrolase
MNYSIKLLWDIDGTLLTTQGRGFPYLVKAIEEEFGKIDLEKNYSFTHGLTDFEVISAILELDVDEVPSSSFERCISSYETMIKREFSANPPLVFPQVRRALAEIDGSTVWKQCIGTGNSYGGALAKLHSANLMNFFEPDGIFCSSPGLSRRNMVMRKAKESLSPNETGIVIGDTPSDIICARENGLKVIAIASGQFSTERLESENPDTVLATNWSVEEFIRSVRLIQQ